MFKCLSDHFWSLPRNGVGLLDLNEDLHSLLVNIMAKINESIDLGIEEAILQHTFLTIRNCLHIVSQWGPCGVHLLL